MNELDKSWVVIKLNLTGTVDRHFWEGLALAIPLGLIPQYYNDGGRAHQVEQESHGSGQVGLPQEGLAVHGRETDGRRLCWNS